MKQLIHIRNHTKDDHPFLFATYLQHNWYDKTNTTTLKKATWMNLQHKRLEDVLENQKVKIACLKDDPDVILGYAFRDGSKPFSYVKLAWRNGPIDIKELLLTKLKEDPCETKQNPLSSPILQIVFLLLGLTSIWKKG